jgi:hypothetical protein
MLHLKIKEADWVVHTTHWTQTSTHLPTHLMSAMLTGALASSLGRVTTSRPLTCNQGKPVT